MGMPAAMTEVASIEPSASSLPCATTMSPTVSAARPVAVEPGVCQVVRR